MLIGGTRVFFQRPDEFAKRILHPGEVFRVDEKTYTAESEEPLALEAWQDIHIYYEIERKFVQQPIRIVGFGPDDADDARDDGDQDGHDETSRTDRTIRFETTGFVISAECRECYRVVTLTANLTAELGAEQDCPLIDVSASGFSVIATTPHDLNEELSATLIHEDKRYSGFARVRSIKTLITGKTRYGLHRVADKDRGNGLETGQQIIGADVQRIQLKRRSGNH